MAEMPFFDKHGFLFSTKLEMIRNFLKRGGRDVFTPEWFLFQDLDFDIFKTNFIRTGKIRGIRQHPYPDESRAAKSNREVQEMKKGILFLLTLVLAFVARQWAAHDRPQVTALRQDLTRAALDGKRLLKFVRPRGVGQEQPEHEEAPAR